MSSLLNSIAMSSYQFIVYLILYVLERLGLDITAILIYFSTSFLKESTVDSWYQQVCGSKETTVEENNGACARYAESSVLYCRY
jgi:hypothetical protein